MSFQDFLNTLKAYQFIKKPIKKKPKRKGLSLSQKKRLIEKVFG